MTEKYKKICPRCKVPLYTTCYSVAPIFSPWYKYYKFRCKKCNYTNRTQNIYWRHGSEAGYAYNIYDDLYIDKKKSFDKEEENIFVHYFRLFVILSGPIIGFILFYLFSLWVSPK